MKPRELDLFSSAAAVEPPPPAPEPVPEARAAAVLPGPRVWTVGEVNRAACLLLEQSLPRMWVSGEVANFSRHRSGHCYFTLKDDAAQIRSVLFRRNAVRLRCSPATG